MNKLLKYKSDRYNHSNDNISVSAGLRIEDKEYLNFIGTGSAGFYFSNALHLYGKSLNKYHNINFINELFLKEYNFLNSELYCFGCDLFGNQFCFKNNEIVFLNIETAQFESMAKNFNGWIDVLVSDYNYFTGQQILKEWEELMLPLKFNERLVPLKPFVIGGEYSPNNMKPLDFHTVIKYNAAIARQVYNLPDGTNMEIVIGTPPSL